MVGGMWLWLGKHRSRWNSRVGLESKSSAGAGREEFDKETRTERLQRWQGVR